MHPLSLLCIIIAAINFSVGAYYFFFYMKMPSIKEQLSFAFLCVGIGLYDVFCAGLYNSQSLAEGIFWQRFQLITVNAICILMVWFIATFSEQWKNRITQMIIFWYTVILCISPFINPEYTLSLVNPAVKNIAVSHIVKITYFEGRLGIFYQAELASAVFGYMYLFYLLIHQYRITRNKKFIFVLICLVVFFVSIASDAAVSMQIYSFVYIMEYTFFFLILAMAYALFSRFVEIHRAYEELNLTLEQKVEERTREIIEAQKDIKTLSGLLPICANCKKIRNDEGYWQAVEGYVMDHSDAIFSHGICPECAKSFYPGYVPSQTKK